MILYQFAAMLTSGNAALAFGCAVDSFEGMLSTESYLEREGRVHEIIPGKFVSVKFRWYVEGCSEWDMFGAHTDDAAKVWVSKCI